MTASNLDVFERTTQKTNLWLKEIMSDMGWDDRRKAYLALRATLQTLRDRLTMEEAVQLGAQLPMLIRGFYYEGWSPSGKPSSDLRDKDQFLACVNDQFPNEDVDAERVVRSVFAVLANRISKGEMEDIKQILPDDLNELWPDGQG